MTNSSDYRAELLQERFGLKIAGRLSDGSDALPSDITERLRHARMQAVARRKQPQARAAELLIAGRQGRTGSGPD